MTSLKDQTVLVTGANRGMGRHYVTQLLDRGVAKVYAAARDPHQIESTDPVSSPWHSTSPIRSRWQQQPRPPPMSVCSSTTRASSAAHPCWRPTP